jgi:hypothetical protein
MRLAVHHRLYRRNPLRYRDLTKSLFLRLHPFEDFFARVEFLHDDEVTIDLLRRDPLAAEKGMLDIEFASIYNGSRHRIMELDEDEDLFEAIRQIEGETSFIKGSLERLQEALLEALIAG